MSDARAALARDYEVNSKENSYLLNQIAFAYEYGEDLQAVFNRQALNEQLTADAVTDAARRYLDLQRYVKVTLVPDTEIGRPVARGTRRAPGVGGSVRLRSPV